MDVLPTRNVAADCVAKHLQVIRSAALRFATKAKPVLPMKIALLDSNAATWAHVGIRILVWGSKDLVKIPTTAANL